MELGRIVVSEKHTAAGRRVPACGRLQEDVTVTDAVAAPARRLSTVGMDAPLSVAVRVEVLNKSHGVHVAEGEECHVA
jgi:hypothetical protein